MGKYTIQELVFDELMRGDAYEQPLVVETEEFVMEDVTEIRAMYTIGKGDSLPRFPFTIERDGVSLLLKIPPSQSKRINNDCDMDMEFYIGGLPYTILIGKIPVKLDKTR